MIALVGLMIVNIPFLTVMGLAAAATVTIAVLVSLTLLPALLGFAGHRLGRTNRLLAWRLRERRAGQPKATVRWATFVTKRPGLILLGGIAGLIAIAGPATHIELGLPDAGSDPATSTERKAYDLLSEGFGPGFNGPLTIVVDAPGLSSAQQAEVAEQTAAGLQSFPGVASVAPPVQNPDKSITILSVTPETSPSSSQTKDLVAELRDRADQVQDETGIEVLVTGTTAINIDTADRLAEALPLYAAVVVGLALLLLMIVFRSIVVPVKAAFGFLLSIAASLGVVVAIFQDGHLADLFDVSKEGPIASFLPVLLIGVLFGLAMDYEVFLVSRMREEYVHTGQPREIDRHRIRPERTRRRGGCADHDRSVRQLRPGGRPDHEVHRPGLGRRCPGGRVRGPDDPGPRRDVPVRPLDLVAAVVAGPAVAERRHRGREPRDHGRPRCHGRKAPHREDAALQSLKTNRTS